MEGMFMHRGGEIVTTEQLDLIKVPEAIHTDTRRAHNATRYSKLSRSD